jgi:hypothetical protein
MAFLKSGECWIGAHADCFYPEVKQVIDDPLGRWRTDTCHCECHQQKDLDPQPTLAEYKKRLGVQ